VTVENCHPIPGNQLQTKESIYQNELSDNHETVK